VIRRAGVDDADAIGEVLVAGWRAAYRGSVSQSFLDALSPVERAAGWRERLRAPAVGVAALVAVDGEWVVGVASFGFSRDDDTVSGTGELYALYVLPEHWRRGTGTLLQRQALDGLAAQGFTGAVVWVMEGNTAARRFYERTGWVLEGGVKTDRRTQNGIEVIFRDVRYRRELTR
jgi:GNAT superfamily N-acetyltransferase